MDPSDEDPSLIHSKFRKALLKGQKQQQQNLQEQQQQNLQQNLQQGQDLEVLSRLSTNDQQQTQTQEIPLVVQEFPQILEIGGTNNPLITAAVITPKFHSEVFRFDSTDRERYLCKAISEEQEDLGCPGSASVFSPGPSPGISTVSPVHPVYLDSPRITISPLHLTDISESAVSAGISESSASGSMMEGQSRLMAGLHTGLAMLPTTQFDQNRLFGIPSPVSPLTPNTPLSPSPLFATDQFGFQQGFLAELYRRRCHSDSDLPMLPETPWGSKNINNNNEMKGTDLSMKSSSGQGLSKKGQRARRPIPHPLTIPISKGGSLESDQDSPLDLSMRGSRERFGSSTSCESLTARFLSSLAIPQHSPTLQKSGVSVVRGDVASPTTRKSVALKYNLEVSPVVEEMQPGNDMAFVCPVCGQMFSLHDRLAKHMASRHKSKPHDQNKSYPCEVCMRSFARSDMLTRHMRLHTGVKPYVCRTCSQVFSRSDHLSTHQRTHTGEKPYKCPSCPYSACRRDMITRHLRTHTRNSSSSSASSADLLSANTPTSTSDSTSPIFEGHSPLGSSSGHIKMEYSPSSSSASNFDFGPSSTKRSPSRSPIPSSPALTLSSLSVNSPNPEGSSDPHKNTFTYKVERQD